MSLDGISIGLIGLLLAYLFLWAVLYLTQDAREPPAVDTLVPFISPLTSLKREGSKYFKFKS